MRTFCQYVVDCKSSQKTRDLSSVVIIHPYLQNTHTIHASQEHNVFGKIKRDIQVCWRANRNATGLVVRCAGPFGTFNSLITVSAIIGAMQFCMRQWGTSAKAHVLEWNGESHSWTERWLPSCVACLTAARLRECHMNRFLSQSSRLGSPRVERRACCWCDWLCVS